MEPNQPVEQPIQIPQPQQTASPTPIMDPQSKSSKLPIMLLTLISLLSLSGLIYFYLQTQSLKQQIAIQPSPTPNSTTQPTSMVDPTQNWQTYTDTSGNFSIKYPPNTKISDASSFSIPAAVNLSSIHPRTGGGGGPSEVGWYIEISKAQENQNNISLEEWAKSKNLMSDLLQKQGNESNPIKTTIGNASALTWTTNGGDLQLTTYLVQQNNKITIIFTNNTDYTDTTTVPQILSSIKFADSQ